jgi:hypothetical protein
VDPEERAAARPRVGHEVRADPLQQRPKVGDEPQERLPNGQLIPISIRLEPLPSVVLSQLPQEPEELRTEVGLVHARLRIDG